MLKEAILRELGRIAGRENVLTAPEVLKVYAYDGTTNWIHEPEVVVVPSNTQQISAIMQVANAHRIAVTPRGGGTNVSGGSVPVMGGIVLCTTRMNKVLGVDKENLSATVETGIILQDLTARLAQDGLFFPPDPQSFFGATLGGAIAENAGGPSCLKYGVTKQYILGLEVVLPTGEIAHLGGRTLKNVVGYDLLHLFISSEGTLGVITVAELKLRPIPPARKTIMVVYDSVEKAGESVSRVFESGVIPCKIELLDNWVINSMEDMLHLGLPTDAEAVLLFETDGMLEQVEKEAKTIVEIVKKHGAADVRVAPDSEEANKYWLARRAGFASIVGRARNVFTEDVTVPIGKMPALTRKCKQLADKYKLDIVVLGHAGDGNLHPSILTDIGDKDLYERSLKALEEIMQAATEMGGVLSGEHGIGLEKRRFFKQAVDPVALDMMKKIKALLDPNNVMNPGKIWD
ncbi:MAG: FAD-linked oxidase C-terminal domain-containing protein [Syntrophorhabdales bacterium]